MIVVATENVPPRLRGRLGVWLLEVRAGIYVGDYGARVREMIRENLVKGLGDGNAVLVWSAPTEAGFEVETFGENRRVPVEHDGMILMAFKPPPGQEAERAPGRVSALDRARARGEHPEPVGRWGEARRILPKPKDAPLPRWTDEIPLDTPPDHPPVPHNVPKTRMEPPLISDTRQMRQGAEQVGETKRQEEQLPPEENGPS